jgi:hypothetical protein
MLMSKDLVTNAILAIMLQITPKSIKAVNELF